MKNANWIKIEDVKGNHNVKSIDEIKERLEDLGVELGSDFAVAVCVDDNDVTYAVNAFAGILFFDGYVLCRPENEEELAAEVEPLFYC